MKFESKEKTCRGQGISGRWRWVSGVRAVKNGPLVVFAPNNLRKWHVGTCICASGPTNIAEIAPSRPRATEKQAGKQRRTRGAAMVAAALTDQVASMAPASAEHRHIEGSTPPPKAEERIPRAPLWTFVDQTRLASSCFRTPQPLFSFCCSSPPDRQRERSKAPDSDSKTIDCGTCCDV